MSESLKDTIAPKSDQLNADDLIAGPMTVTVEWVKRGDKDQPVHIGLVGFPGRPYKPCKSMRRVLITAWGEYPQPWVGRSMTLYCDPEVSFGGVKVGGIRISELSGIDRDLAISLTEARGRKKPFLVKKMAGKEPSTATQNYYDEAWFAANVSAMVKRILAGKTLSDVVAMAEKSGWLLTEDQKDRLADAAEAAALPSE